MSPRVFKFILGSLFLHGFLLAVLFVGAQTNDGSAETVIEFIQARSQKAVREKVFSTPKKGSSISNPSVSPPQAQVESAPTTAESPAPQEQETDLEAVLRGRGPRNETEKYLADLREQIARHQVYPAASRSFREEGVVQLRLNLLRDGRVQKIELIGASKYPRLNNAAIKAVAKAAPFRNFPTEVAQESWVITLPVRFALSL